MNFNYTEEQEMLRDTLQRFIAKDYTFNRRKAIANSPLGYSPEHWQTLAELGVLGISFPESYGGIGGNAVDTMLVMEGIGQGLVLEPYMATVVLCGQLILHSDDQRHQATLLPAIASGALLMALAHYENGGRFDAGTMETVARRDGFGYVLNGGKSFVLHGKQADRYIVSARTRGEVCDPEGISLFLVDKESEGVHIREYAMQDGQRAAEISFHDVKVKSKSLLGVEHLAWPVLEQALDAAMAALCAEAVGAMQVLHQITLDYVKTRKQFGATLGSFQVVQHRLVDMFIAIEQARSMAILASVHVSLPDRIERRRTMSAAKVLIGQAARYVGQQAVQLHGGMGMTDELNVSHYFKRLTVINLMFGDADHHLGQFSDLMLAA